MKLVYAVDKGSYGGADHIGVRKKIEAMLKLFEKEGIQASLHQYEWKNGFPMLETEDDTDLLYFRRIDPSIKMICKLWDLKKKNRKLRIVMEIPTYPFKGEKKEKLSWKRRISYFVGHALLRFVLDRIVLTGQEKRISYLYGVPVLHGSNGVDYEDIAVRNNSKKKNELHLIAVSGCYFWHGYDRLIKGLGNYYKDREPKIKVYFHLVGEGDCLEEYKQLAKDRELTDQYVFFYGRLIGQELDRVYNKSDMGVDCLACHRKNIYFVSSLKVREYAAKGLPIVSSTGIDINCDDVADYILMLPADETDICIDTIVEYAEKIYADLNDPSAKIREAFYPYVEWKYSFADVIKYIKEEI